VISISKAKATMARAELTTIHTAGLHTSNLTIMFTVMQVSRTQCCVWTKLDNVQMVT